MALKPGLGNGAGDANIVDIDRGLALIAVEIHAVALWVHAGNKIRFAF